MANLKPGTLVKISGEYNVDYLNGLIGEITYMNYYAHVYVFELKFSLILSEREFIVVSNQ